LAFCARGGGEASVSNENGIAASGADTSPTASELVLALPGAFNTSCTALRRSAREGA
jgi:hypothetical protein